MFPKINRLKDVSALRAHLSELGWDTPVDETVLTGNTSPLGQPIQVGSVTVGNRFCIHPMEGWDANRDGSPSEYTLRRWKHFGDSGAKLIWGGEAAAVRPDGRANPNQTLGTPENRAGLAKLLETLLEAHAARFGSTDDLLVGLQLTHSGRFCKPDDHFKMAPRIAYHHPLLDAKFKIDPDDDSVVWTDDELERLMDAYVSAAQLAQEVGYRFVDVKACHGYLLHEFLSARRRPGPFGGDLEGRSRLLCETIRRVQAACPGLMVGVRLSIFDFVPYQTSREVGQPMPYEDQLPYDCGFGVDPNNPLAWDLTEPLELVGKLEALGVVAINLSCGSPYYNPHIQRPAAFPPSDGYLPPEDPLVGVCRQIESVRRVKEAFPNLPIAGSGYSYLQDYLPHVAQAVVRAGWVDFVGLGRMVLSYHDMPADILGTGKLERKRICRTFSDCTTGPRNGLISGCYPLDPDYKQLPEHVQIKEIKKALGSVDG